MLPQLKERDDNSSLASAGRGSSTLLSTETRFAEELVPKSPRSCDKICETTSSVSSWITNYMWIKSCCFFFFMVSLPCLSVEEALSQQAWTSLPDDSLGDLSPFAWQIDFIHCMEFPAILLPLLPLSTLPIHTALIASHYTSPTTSQGRTAAG